jgi:hypothetical protein
VLTAAHELVQLRLVVVLNVIERPDIDQDHDRRHNGYNDRLSPLLFSADL